MSVHCLIERIPLPPDSLIASALPRIDYSDTYAAVVSDRQADDPAVFARVMLAYQPAWERALLRLRNFLVQPFGLKTGGVSPIAASSIDFQPGSSVSLFHVLARSRDEILLGLDDKHLDVRLSYLIEREGARRRILVSTTVLFHNALGRTYFFFVKPFHRWMIPGLMRTALSRSRA